MAQHSEHPHGSGPGAVGGRAAARRRRRRTRRLRTTGLAGGAGALAVVAAVATGWVALPGRADAETLRTTAEGALTMCTELSYMPFEFEQGAEIVGFDVDVASLVADRLGLPLRTVDTPFTDIVSGAALQEGRCDLALSAISITDERQEVVDFSAGYFTSQLVVVVPEGSPVASEADLAGLPVGAAIATTGEEYAEQLGAEVTTAVTLEDLVATLEAGTVAAVVADNGAMLSWVSEHPGYRVAVESADVEHYGVAVPRGDTAALSVVNAAIAQARSDGTYAEVYRKWFNDDPPA